MALLLFSCSRSSYNGYDYWKELHEEHGDLKGKVQLVSRSEDEYYIEYNGQSYEIDKLDLFDVRGISQDLTANDVLIGWDALPIPVWYIDEYYSDTADNPIFIYISRYNQHYIRSDYQYESDVFILEGTEHGIVFSDMLVKTDAIDYDYIFTRYVGEIEVLLYSEKYPRLRIPLRVFCVDNVWYAGGITSDITFEATSEFIDLLIESGHISAE